MRGPTISAFEPSCSQPPCRCRFISLYADLSLALKISRRVIVGMAFDLHGANGCAAELEAPFDRCPNLDQRAPLIGWK